jgi:YcaO-like protein with predicted kinase domain
MTTTMTLPPALSVPVPKTFRGGTHRIISPEQTIARVRPFLPVMGITRVANITGLDRIGVPVVVVVRPNSRSLSVSQGKGLDLPSAKASALMESIEAWHAERIVLPMKLGSYEDLRYTHPLADVEELPRIRDSVFHPDLPLLWTEGFDILRNEAVWSPYELVHTNYTLPHATGHGCFAPSSNGLASGNHLLEAISHGICEVVERDATALWYALSDEEQHRSRVDPDTVDDSNCREVLDRYERAGVGVVIWEITSDVGIPAFMCIITEREEHRLHTIHSAAGMGCHPVRGVALLRALTEAAQSRLTIIAGSRDDIFRDDYERVRGPDVLRRDRELLRVHAPMRHFHDGPSFESESFNEDVAWELERLASVGVTRVIVHDLTRHEMQIPVVRVVIPGLEGPSSLQGYAPGSRVRARLARAAL